MSRVTSWISRNKGWLKIGGTFLTGVVTVSASVWTYLHVAIDAAVTKRLAPYEQLTTGLSLNQGEDWDQAAGVFRQALRDAEAAKLPSEATDLMYDGLLLALTNCDSPAQFSPELEKIRNRTGSVTPETAWRQNQIGYYFLRTGKTLEAKQCFVRSRQLYDSRQERRQASDPIHGLWFAALAEGNIDEALRLASDLQRRDPKTYGLPAWLQELDAWNQERWSTEFRGLYPQFDDTLQRFLVALRTPKQ